MVATRVHSRVGVITNSSSEIYTEITDDYEDALFAIAEQILKSLGIEQDARSIYDVVKFPLPYRDTPADGEELPLNSENWTGYLNTNYRIALVAKNTGVELDFMAFFDRLYSQESCYNG